ncbi:MAG: hypothetical protein ACREJO_02230 [Phycisphaerales bacterium]
MNALKPFLDWVKSHYIVAALLGLAILAVPAAVYFSGDWSDKIQKQAQTETNTLATSVKMPNLTYKTNGSLDQPPIEYPGPPNQELINHFGGLRSVEAKQAAEVVTRAIEVNQTDRPLLVEGLFPAPSQQDETIKRRDFARAFFGEGLQQLLKKHRASGPRSPAELAVDLADAARKLAQVDNVAQLTADQLAAISAQLWAARVSAYKAYARNTGIYADLSTFRLPQASEEPTLREAFDFQQQYWIFDDIFSIADAANLNTSGGVPGDVVKRIVSIDVEPMRLPAPVTDAASGGTDPSAPDFRASITGRVGGNSLYDIRYANAEFIVSAPRFATFLNAVGRNRFVSVVGLSIEKVDVLEDLKAGYYYGDEMVVRAKVRFETVWLRDWLKGIFPPELAAAFGVAPPAAADPNAPATPATPAAPEPAAPGGKGRAKSG